MLVLSRYPYFGIGLTAPVVIVVYLGMAAPAVAILGFLYALGLAEVDSQQEGPVCQVLSRTTIYSGPDESAGSRP